MSVFANYNSNQAGGVNANALPRMHPIPWKPIQNNVRANPNIPSQPQRIQPHERGTFFPTSASGGGTLAPSMSSGGCGCGGSCGNGTSQSDMGGGSADTPVSPTSTAAQIATGHSFAPSHNPISLTHHMGVLPVTRSRATGNLRATPVKNGARFSTGGGSKMMGVAFMGGRLTR